MHAQADMGSELQDNSLDSRLKAIREKTADATAKSQLEAMKAQLAAKKAAADGVSINKTM
jgi:hypothetical protein